MTTSGRSASAASASGNRRTGCQTMHITPHSELDSRISKLQAHLAHQSLDGALIVQNTDLFYFTGTIQQSHLYVPTEGKPLLMTRRSLARAKVESGLEEVVSLSTPRDLPRLIQE